MTRDETVRVLSLLKAAYPNSYKGMSKQEGIGVISVWSSQFATVPVDLVIIAINKLISTKPFPPSISEVKEKIKSLYYEATTELVTANNDLPSGTRKRLESIASYCKQVDEPSLLSIVERTEETLQEPKSIDYIEG